jgi:hypothetical protein
VHQLPESVGQQQLESEITLLCNDPAVDGVLVQLPLPSHLDEEAAMERLEPRWAVLCQFHGCGCMRCGVPSYMSGLVGLGAMYVAAAQAADMLDRCCTLGR